MKVVACLSFSIKKQSIQSRFSVQGVIVGLIEHDRKHRSSRGFLVGRAMARATGQERWGFAMQSRSNANAARWGQQLWLCRMSFCMQLAVISRRLHGSCPGTCHGLWSSSTSASTTRCCSVWERRSLLWRARECAPPRQQRCSERPNVCATSATRPTRCAIAYLLRKQCWVSSAEQAPAPQTMA